MKKLIVPAFLLSLVIIPQTSISSINHCSEYVSVFQDGHVVKPEDLPRSLKDALATNYKDWTIQQAVLVNGGNNAENTVAPGTVNTNAFYELSLNKGKENKVLRFYQDGTAMK